MHSNSQFKYYLAQHFATFLLGFTGIIGKIVLQHPFVIVFFRALFSFFSVFFLFSKKKKFNFFQFSLKSHFFFSITAVILVLHWFAFFLGIQKSNASIGTLAFSIYPFFLTFLEPYFFSARYSFFKSFLCVFLLLGVFLLTPKFSFDNQVFVGICWGVISGLLMAVFILINRGLSQKFLATQVVFFQNFYSVVFSLPFAWFFFQWNISWQELGLLFLLGFFCTALSQTLIIFSLKKITASSFGVINALESVYAIIFSFLLLGEILSFKSYLGAIIILLCTFAFNFNFAPNFALNFDGLRKRK